MRQKSSIKFLIRSWACRDCRNSLFQEILDWLDRRNREAGVAIRTIPLSSCKPWFYDAEEGCLRNPQRSFFSITGCQDAKGFAQPVIVQNEIGYLGILCKVFDGVLHFLMQAKIEPGNVNCVQLSPTIQATRSNFTRRHGGRTPAYLDFFLNPGPSRILADQIQSEQSSRFFKKRNRNIVLLTEEDVPVLPSHKWMTLGQIKRLMRYDNLVNMDTRTVLSCLPFLTTGADLEEKNELKDLFSDKPLCRSLFHGDGQNHLPEIYSHLNNRKMFAGEEARLVPLSELRDWHFSEEAFVCRHPAPFRVIFCDISIEGREVRHWTQPLMEAAGIATFGLLCCEDEGILKCVVRATPEIGCFDRLELGPTVQREAVPRSDMPEDALTDFFFDCLARKRGVFFDHLLSEEGGRFYHEQNRNVLIRVSKEELPPLPEDCFLLDLRTLCGLTQINNILNIQLRNLLSLFEA